MEEERRTTVSFAIATLNSEATIGDCLQSIRSQDYPQSLIEIVVADGGSVDDTREICSSFGAKVISNPMATEKTFAGGKNLAIHSTTGEVIVVVDSDNVLASNQYVATLLGSLSQYPAAVAVSPLITADPRWKSFQRYAGYVYDSFDHRFVLAAEELALKESPVDREGNAVVTASARSKIYLGNGTGVRRAQLLDAGGYDYDLEAGRRLARLGTFVLSRRLILYHHNALSIRQYVRKKLRGIGDLMLRFKSREGDEGFVSLVLRQDDQPRRFLLVQAIANLSLLYPTYVALKEGFGHRDSAFLWHVLMAPLVTLLYALEVLSSARGRELVRVSLVARSSPSR
jgi:glycosyltransferase involved in cell wall biosynthesis